MAKIQLYYLTGKTCKHEKKKLKKKTAKTRKLQDRNRSDLIKKFDQK